MPFLCWLGKGLWTSQPANSGFSLKNIAGKMVVFFGLVAGAAKSTELLTKDTDANAADTHFTISVIDGLIN